MREAINKIKDLIDDLVIRFKGTEQEKQLREVQKKFLELYNSTDADIVKKPTAGTKYAIGKNNKQNIAKTWEDEYNGHNPLSTDNRASTRYSSSIKWVYDAEIFSDVENTLFHEKIGEINQGSKAFQKNRQGEYMLSIENKIVFTDGNYNAPQIHRIIEVFTEYQTEFETIKERIFRYEKGKSAKQDALQLFEQVHGIRPIYSYGSGIDGVYDWQDGQRKGNSRREVIDNYYRMQNGTGNGSQSQAVTVTTNIPLPTSRFEAEEFNRSFIGLLQSDNIKKKQANKTKKKANDKIYQALTYDVDGDFYDNLKDRSKENINKILNEIIDGHGDKNSAELREMADVLSTVFAKGYKFTNETKAGSKGSASSIAEIDNNYLSAIENGDTETAQKLVDEAAESLGYVGTYYHGSKSDFTIFSKDKGGKSNSTASIGFWFTDSQEGAENWANETWYGDNEKGKVYKSYLNLKNPKVYETVDNKSKIDELRKGYDYIDTEMSLLDSIYSFDDGRYYHRERYDYDRSRRRRSGISEWDAFKAIVSNYDADTVEYYLSQVSEGDRQTVKDDAQKYLELSKERKGLEKQITELSYSDAYELFKTDIYKQIGMNAEDANIGGTGKYVENKDEMLQKYVDSLKNEGYDGIIIKNTSYDSSVFGGNNTQYVVFDPNQVKSAEPVTYDDKGKVIPLSKRFDKSNDDTRYSLSAQGTTDYNKSLQSIRYNGDILPIREDIKPKSTESTAKEYPDNLLPLREDEANAMLSEQNNVAPLTDADVPPEFYTPDYDTDEYVPESPLKDRDVEDVGNRKVKAYMYENPEVKPYFQFMAYSMLADLNNTTKGERTYNEDLHYESGGELGWMGTKRHTSPEIANLLDSFKYTYKQIEDGLNAIIQDHGAENNAVSKRIEFALDEMLREGYTDFYYGVEVPPNQEYINLLRDKEITEYSDEAFNYWASTLKEEDYKPSETVQDDIAPVRKDIAPVQEPVAQADIAPVRDDILPVKETQKPVAKKEFVAPVKETNKPARL